MRSSRCFSVLVGSGLYLVNSSSQSSAQYFLTISEMMAKKDTLIDKQIRISGAVIGDSIQFDNANGKLSFFIANVPADYAEVEKQGGLAIVLKNAVNDPTRQKIQIVYSGEKPDLLHNMAQAIIVGKLNQDGVFYADEILLKCPSRYEEAVPDQAVGKP
ncbi:MAG: cytochrome c maturation protein CcmE [Chloroflexota bacterium]